MGRRRLGRRSGSFVRCLWHLDKREGNLSHGLWYYDRADPDALKRLLAEAERCGVTDRFHLVEDPGPEQRWMGHAVFLPSRGEPRLPDLVRPLECGRRVVTFMTKPILDPAITVCSPLDLDAAAAALVVALGTDRTAERTRRAAPLQSLRDLVIGSARA